MSVAGNSVDTAPKKLPGRPFPAGVSGNPSGRPKGDGLVRELLLEAFQNSRAGALEALERRFKSPKTVQETIELLAKLEGELGKDVAGDTSRIAVIVIQGEGAIDPDELRARVLAQRALPVGGTADGLPR